MSRYHKRFIATKSKLEEHEALRKRKRRSTKMPAMSKAKDFHAMCKHFFYPMINSPYLEDFSLEEKLEFLFATELRQIITFFASDYFKMPGHVPYPEKSEALNFNIKVGDILWVRVDIRTPDIIDIESLKNNCVYRLTSAQYATILDGKIERLSPCKKIDSSD